MTAMGTENGIMRRQMSTHSRRNRFLADIRMARAMNQPSLVRTSQLLLRLANDLHRAVEELCSGEWQMESGGAGHGLLLGLDGSE